MAVDSATSPLWPVVTVLAGATLAICLAGTGWQSGPPTALFESALALLLYFGSVALPFV